MSAKKEIDFPSVEDELLLCRWYESVIRGYSSKFDFPDKVKVGMVYFAPIRSTLNLFYMRHTGDGHCVHEAVLSVQFRPGLPP